VVRFGFLSTYPPTLCGLASFTDGLRAALPGGAVGGVVRVVDSADEPPPAGVVGELVPGSASGCRNAAMLLNREDIAILQHDYGIYHDDDLPRDSGHCDLGGRDAIAARQERDRITRISDRRVGCDHHCPRPADVHVGRGELFGDIRCFGASDFGKMAFDRRQLVQSLETGLGRVARRDHDNLLRRHDEHKKFPPPW